MQLSSRANGRSGVTKTVEGYAEANCATGSSSARFLYRMEPTRTRLAPNLPMECCGYQSRLRRHKATVVKSRSRQGPRKMAKDSGKGNPLCRRRVNKARELTLAGKKQPKRKNNSAGRCESP